MTGEQTCTNENSGMEKKLKKKIKDVRARVVSVPLKDEWKISLYSASCRQHTIVEVVTDDGVMGYGESSPSPAFMGETAETIKLIVENYLRPAVIGMGISDIAQIHERMNQVIYSHSAAKSAVDIAVHDAWGKSTGLSVNSLIGGRYRDRVSLSYVVGIKDNDRVCDEVRHVIKEGFRTVKVKVGKSPERDIALVNDIREVVNEAGVSVGIRLDANQGYDVATAIRVIRDLEKTGELEAVEQPTRKWDLFGLREIRDRVRTPIMIDETVFSPEDAMIAIRMGVADMINIKVCKVGGLYQSRKIAAMAESAGMRCTVGSNLELGVGIAASLHFAASTPSVNMASDFTCGAYLHDYDLTSSCIITSISEGSAPITDAPGLGVELEAHLEEIA